MKAMHLKHVKNDPEELESLADLTGLDEEFEEVAEFSDYLILPDSTIEGGEWILVPETTFHNYYEFVGEETDDFVEIRQK